MKRIGLLSETTANKIAAGEVVERASSVVKEVVENSLDAESKNITIEIEESGNKLIRVRDDGSGIHPEDINKAFLPHGTSKIKSIEDIYSVASFGFRGEALPSIAAVSKVRLKSRPAEFEMGKEIVIDGGKTISVENVGCNPGTEIEISDLFYNTPARQKFLKSPQREKSIINDLVLKLALGNYKTSFNLYNDGKQIIKTYGGEDIDNVIRVLYGKEVVENIVPIENYGDILSVYGYIGTEAVARGSRNRQSIFVNKRLIKSSLITAAVENAYKSFYLGNKFPFFALYIDIFPEYVDPNVHPSKAEIKFLEERLLFKTVFDSVHNALKDFLRKSFSVEETTFPEVSDDILKESAPAPRDNTTAVQLDYINKFEKDPGITETVPSYLKESITAAEKAYGIEPEATDSNDYNQGYEAEKTHSESLAPSYPVNTVNREAKFPQLKIIGQCFKSYILAEAGEELYLIDQHAAHEKILFEKYRQHIASLSVNSQILAVPTIIHLTHEEYGIYKENEELFKASGFIAEDFGDNDVLVREVPLFLGKPQVEDLFQQIIDNIRSMGSGLTVDVKYNKIASLACKAAVKAHDKLSDMEIEGLINELRFIEDPFNCPHGRPTILKYKLKDIEKSFKRIL